MSLLWCEKCVLGRIPLHIFFHIMRNITRLPDDIIHKIAITLFDMVWTADEDVARTIASFKSVCKKFYSIGFQAEQNYGTLADARQVPFALELKRALNPYRVRARIDVFSLSVQDVSAETVVIHPALKILEWRAFSGNLRIEPAAELLGLHTLKVSGINFHSDLFGILTTTCPQLEELSLFNVRYYGTPVASFEKLRSLCIEMPDGQTIKSITKLIGYGLPALIQLQISQGDLNSDHWRGFNYLFRKANRLNELTLIEMKHADHNTIVPQKRMKLKSLVISFIHAREVERLLSALEIGYLDLTFVHGRIDPMLLVGLPGLHMLKFGVDVVHNLDFLSIAPANLSIFIRVRAACMFNQGEYDKLQSGQDICFWMEHDDGGDPPEPLPERLPVLSAVSLQATNSNGVTRQLWSISN